MSGSTGGVSSEAEDKQPARMTAVAAAACKDEYIISILLGISRRLTEPLKVSCCLHVFSAGKNIQFGLWEERLLETEGQRWKHL